MYAYGLSPHAEVPHGPEDRVTLEFGIPLRADEN
jgi:hypothetical protein